ncbi:DUF6461 domain-containing protein [Streptomyces sp. NPDC051920]|uniref:DUF6461 domain-containing protein n=1 Tax=Streptomyces sp. NPDC051920 TaxID=3155523 RepID=UPI00341C1D12
MCDGIVWLADWDDAPVSVVFARGISPQELAVRMGGTPGSAVELTGGEVDFLLHRTPTGDSDVVRVGTCGAWSYAVQHVADYGRDHLAVRASRGGVDVIHYVPMAWHPPAQFNYFRDGRSVCGFGIGEETQRWGQEPDHLLPVLVAAGVLAPQGKTLAVPEDGSSAIGNHRTLSVLEHHFELCLPKASMTQAPLPAYTVRGPLALSPDPDFPIIRAWAAHHGYSLDWGRSGHVPASIRDAYSRATGTR